MSVVIDELQVEIQDQPTPPAASATAPAKKQIRFRSMMEAFQEREERLQAD